MLGYGLGLRSEHYDCVLAGDTRAQWFEALTENYLGLPGQGLAPAADRLARIRERYPLTLHGVSLSIGGTAEIDADYLRRLEALIDRVEPAWISDHLCWTGPPGQNLHDLLPLSYRARTLAHVVDRIDSVQARLGRQLVIENVSSYATYPSDEMSEAEFVAEVVKRSGCGLLLDINNIYVSARNHAPRRGQSWQAYASQYLAQMPYGSVRQVHLAGHRNKGDWVIDTHDRPVCEEVWQLFGAAWPRLLGAAVMIEWDADIPPIARLDEELDRARAVASAAIGTSALSVEVRA